MTVSPARTFPAPQVGPPLAIATEKARPVYHRNATPAPRLAGRHKIIAYFDNLVLSAVTTGRGSGYLLSGEHGIGKSQLARAFVHRAGQKGIRTFSGRCLPHGSSLRSLRESLLRAGDEWPDTVGFDDHAPAEMVAEQLIAVPVGPGPPQYTPSLQKP